MQNAERTTIMEISYTKKRIRPTGYSSAQEGRVRAGTPIAACLGNVK
jgi:hypothetical protein